MAQKTRNKEAVRVTGKDLLEAYTLLLAARGLDITDNAIKDLDAAKSIIEKRAMDFSIVIDYLTTKKN